MATTVTSPVTKTDVTKVWGDSVVTSLGEKVLKEGDTMTGLLTLSGNPTGVLHAAPKQYVDTLTINAQVGTSYTLALTDVGKLITLTNAGAIALAVPTNATVAFPIGTQIQLAQLGAGRVTVSGTGVVGTPSLLFRAQYSAASLIKYGTDNWLLIGDLLIP